jgi:hypothetical protein
MLKGFPIVIFICLSTFCIDGALGRAPAKPLGAPELESLLKPYLSLKSLSANFVQKKHLQDLNLDLTSTGQLQVKNPHIILWTLQKPSFLEVRISQKDLTITTAKDKEPQKISFAQMGEQGAGGLALLVPWLEMDVNQLLKNYRIEKLEPLHLQFTPTQKSLFKNIELHLSKNHHIQTLTFMEQSGDSIEIEFKAVKIEKLK